MYRVRVLHTFLIYWKSCGNTMRSGKSNICHLSSIAYRSCYDFWFILIPLQHFSDFQNKCGRWIAICFFPSDEGADKVRAGARCVPCLCDWKNQSRIRANPLFGQFTNRLESILTDPTLMTKLGDILESLIPCSTICSQSVICGSTSTLTGFSVPANNSAISSITF